MGFAPLYPSYYPMADGRVCSISPAHAGKELHQAERRALAKTKLQDLMCTHRG
jgi:hypothetical protein